MRSALSDRSRLPRAMASYRQAVKTAADMPDTFLRMAIVAAALGKEEAVEAAMARALAIDPRLAGGLVKPAAELDRVFGDTLAGEPPPVENRTRQLLASIFSSDQGELQPAGVNWIAEAWHARLAGPVALAAAE